MIFVFFSTRVRDTKKKEVQDDDEMQKLKEKKDE